MIWGKWQKGRLVVLAEVEPVPQLLDRHAEVVAEDAFADVAVGLDPGWLPDRVCPEGDGVFHSSQGQPVSRVHVTLHVSSGRCGPGLARGTA